MANNFNDGHASAKDQWLPIETAPKDGKAILVGRFVSADGQAYCNGRIAVDWYRGPDLQWGMFNKRHWPATHCMPLPDAPSIDAAMGARKQGEN